MQHSHCIHYALRVKTPMSTTYSKRLLWSILLSNPSARAERGREGLILQARYSRLGVPLGLFLGRKGREDWCSGDGVWDSRE